MTDERAVQSYDFRQPRRLADDVAHLLSAWQRAMCLMVADHWQQNLGLHAKCESDGQSLIRGSDVGKIVNESTVCFRVKMGQPDDNHCYLSMPRALVLALVGTMLGESIDQMPEDRSLTDVEASLLELAVQDLAAAMQDAQPGRKPLSCILEGALRHQEALRILSGLDAITLIEVRVLGDFGDAAVSWLIPQSTLLALTTQVSESRDDANAAAPELEENIRRIPVRIVVQLGRATLHLSDLANLQVGDVILLDQRVSDPLTAEVAGMTKFIGWPGRMGNRQAFQVAGLVDEEQD